MHGEVRGVPWRADPDLVGRMDRCLEKKNYKQDHKDLFHFSPLGNQKPIQQSLIMYLFEVRISFCCCYLRPLAYLMTLSALASTFGGIGSPICFAAFRLMMNSNFFGCSMGRSAGSAP